MGWIHLCDTVPMMITGQIPATRRELFFPTKVQPNFSQTPPTLSCIDFDDENDDGDDADSNGESHKMITRTIQAIMYFFFLKIVKMSMAKYSSVTVRASLLDQ